MARFVFQLEALLRTRRAAERERMRALAVVERERIELEDRLRRLAGLVQHEREELRAALGHDPAGSSAGQAGTAHRIDARAVRMQTAASVATDASARRLALQLAGVHTRLDQARALLLEATTQRRALEVLREQRFEAWKREQDRRETLALDELAVLRAARTPHDEDPDARPVPGPALGTNLAFLSTQMPPRPPLRGS